MLLTMNYPMNLNSSFTVSDVQHVQVLKEHAITLYDPSEEDKIVRIETMGIPFVHEEVKNGEWVEVKERHARKNANEAIR